MPTAIQLDMHRRVMAVVRGLAAKYGVRYRSVYTYPWHSKWLTRNDLGMWCPDTGDIWIRTTYDKRGLRPMRWSEVRHTVCHEMAHAALPDEEHTEAFWAMCSKFSRWARRCR